MSHSLGIWAKLGNGEDGTENAPSSLLWLPGEGYCLLKELDLLSNLSLPPNVGEWLTWLAYLEKELCIQPSVPFLGSPTTLRKHIRTPSLQARKTPCSAKKSVVTSAHDQVSKSVSFRGSHQDTHGCCPPNPHAPLSTPLHPGRLGCVHFPAAWNSPGHRGGLSLMISFSWEQNPA